MSSPRRKRHPETPGGRRVAEHFWRAGVEYYVSGRQAFEAGLVTIAGNVFHHAIEFMLKGQLAVNENYKNFFEDYGHDLGSAWKKVKQGFYSGFFSEYQVSDHIRICSVPVPAAFFHLDDGRWVDFIVPFPCAVAVLNTARTSAKHIVRILTP